MAGFNETGKRNDFGAEVQVAQDVRNKLPSGKADQINAKLKTVRDAQDAKVDTGATDFSGDINTQSTDRVRTKDFSRNLANDLDTKCQSEIEAVRNANMLADQQEANALGQCVNNVVAQHTSSDGVRNLMRMGSVDSAPQTASFSSITDYASRSRVQ